MKSHRARWALVFCAFLVVSVWWFYPTKGPEDWYVGTAPNPKNLPGRRPRLASFLEVKHVTGVELYLDGTKVEQSVRQFRQGQVIDVKGMYRARQLPKGTLVFNPEINIVGDAINSFGNLGFTMEGHTILEVTPSIIVTEEETVVDFKGTWTIPDHRGDFEIWLVCYFARPAEKIVTQRILLQCPATIE